MERLKKDIEMQIESANLTMLDYVSDEISISLSSYVKGLAFTLDLVNERLNVSAEGGCRCLMSNPDERLIDNKSFIIREDHFGSREGYYDLRFGDESSGTVITCHKSHLVALARDIVRMGELYE